MIFKYFNNIHFAYQPVLFLLLLIPIFIGWYVRKQPQKTASIPFSGHLSEGLTSSKNYLWQLPFMLRIAALSLIILAMARPQSTHEIQRTTGEGIDIMLCMDVSGSMTAQDFTPNRLEAAKKVAVNFVNKRKTDRIGLVIFSGESFTRCPLTTDYSMLIHSIEQIRNGMLEDGTAIGSGLASSVERLRPGKSKSKIILLLTDGENNGGLIDPKTAKEIAKTFGIKVYTIGMASDGFAIQPVKTSQGIVMENQKITIDEKLLREIAIETGGSYFRAKDNLSLQTIYSDIDTMEKTPVEINRTIKYSEKYFPLILIALVLLILEMLLKYTILRKFP